MPTVFYRVQMPKLSRSCRRCGCGALPRRGPSDFGLLLPATWVRARVRARARARVYLGLGLGLGCFRRPCSAAAQALLVEVGGCGGRAYGCVLRE
eukprot:scaffold115184_cov30-Phaeocystis_antarctica.AAC.1